MKQKMIVLLALFLGLDSVCAAQSNPVGSVGPQPAAPESSSASVATPHWEQPQSPANPPALANPQTVQSSLDKLLAVCSAVQLTESEKGDLDTLTSGALNSDLRGSVVAFKKELHDFYVDCVGHQGDLKSDLRELRLAANVRTGTSMLNPGMNLIGLQSAYREAASQLDQVRPDKQVSGQPDSAGTTSLVSKNGGTAILALAVDSGALTSSVNGTATTISGNLEGLGSFLAGKSPISIDPTHRNKLWTIAGRVNVNATFELAQPSTQSTTSTQPATGTSPSAGTQVTIPSSVGKLTGITMQYAMRNPFNPHSATFQSNWEAMKKDLIKPSQDVLTGNDPLVNSLDCKACQTDWTIFQTKLQKGIADKNPKEVADVFDAYTAQVIADAKSADKNFNAKVVAAAKATKLYQDTVSKAVDSAVGNLFTLEYDFAKPASQPESHTFKFAYGNVPSGQTGIRSILSGGSGAKSLFTANLGINIYGGAIPTSAKYGRLHYGQASAEFDRPITLVSSSVPAVFSLAGYWQYQPTASVLNINQSDVAPGTTIDAPTQVLVGTAGSLWVTQAKITLGKGKSGVTVPIGVKWSNKTELLTGNKIGGQVGISYDFSSLSNLFGGGN